MSVLTVCPYLAFSRLLESGEEAKDKGTRKVGGAGKRKRFPVFFFSFHPFYFRVCTFFNSANPTGGAWNRPRVRIRRVQEPIGSWRFELKMYGTKQTDRNNYEVSVS